MLDAGGWRLTVDSFPMSKENVLFSIIGVLFGVIVGFIFVISVNQRGGATASGAGSTASQQTLPSNAVKDQQGMQTAAEEAAKLARAEPKNFEAQTKVADLYYNAGRYDDSLEFLLRANELRPTDYDVLVALGNVNYDAGNFDVAERWYSAALLKNPDDINVRTDLGLTFLLRAQPDIDRAIAEFRRSLERNSSHEPTLQNLVVALTRKRDFTEAQATLAKLEQVNSGNQALTTLRTELEKARASAAPASASSQKVSK